MSIDKLNYKQICISSELTLAPLPNQVKSKQCFLFKDWTLISYSLILRCAACLHRDGFEDNAELAYFRCLMLSMIMTDMLIEHDDNMNGTGRETHTETDRDRGVYACVVSRVVLHTGTEQLAGSDCPGQTRGRGMLNLLPVPVRPDPTHVLCLTTVVLFPSRGHKRRCVAH